MEVNKTAEEWYQEFRNQGFTHGFTTGFLICLTYFK